MTDLDDLRKRAEACFHDTWPHGPLIRDLLAAVQELKEQNKTLRAAQKACEFCDETFEPVTAEELDAIIDGTELGGDGTDIIRVLGPLYRQRKT
jgi:hypothetical protein